MKKITLMLISLSLLSPINVNAATIWWMGHHGNDWENVDNWGRSGDHFAILPEQGGGKAYVTTSDHAEMSQHHSHFLDNPLVKLNDQGDAQGIPQQRIMPSPFYIGGWDIFDIAQHQEHDPDNYSNPDPNASIIYKHSGILDLKRGDITMGVNPNLAAASRCYYLRVGSYGAKGTINQSGGKVSNCTFMTFGNWGPDSVGTWNLTGGTIETLGFDLGNQGIGFFDMRGGTLLSIRGNIAVNNDGDVIDLENDGIDVDDINASSTRAIASEADVWNTPGSAGATTTMIIGRGYNHSSSNAEDTRGYLPGVGVFNQIDGLVDVGKVEVSHGPGSVGILAIRRNAEFYANEGVVIGTYGKGSMIQTGGTTDLKKGVTLGAYEGAFGELTLSGGEFRARGPMLLGRQELKDEPSHSRWSGTANMTIVGSSTSQIRIYGEDTNSLIVYPSSRLTFLFDDSEDHITPISTNKQINFGSNVSAGVPEIDLGFILHGSQTGVLKPGVNIDATKMPQEGDKILIMESDYRVVDPQNLKPTPRAELLWKLKGEEIGTVNRPKKIYAVYCPSYTYDSSGTSTAHTLTHEDCLDSKFYCSDDVSSSHVTKCE